MISLSQSIFCAAAPKGRCPVGHRGEFPDIHPCIHMSPVDHLGLILALPGLILALQAVKLALPGLNLAFSGRNLAFQALNQPSRPHISPPDLRLALQASNHASWLQISPPGLNPAFLALNLSFWLQACPPTSLKFAFQTKNLPSRPHIHLQYTRYLILDT